MKTKIVLLFAIILCAYAAGNEEKKTEEDDMLKDKRQTEEGNSDGMYRSPRKQEQAAPVEEPQEDDKSSGKPELEEYRPGQVFSLNAQELLELQPERKAPLAGGQQLQQLQQLYANPQPEQKQNLQPFYYLDPQLSPQVSLQPSHTVIARPHYSSNGGEASVGAALSVSDTGSGPAHTFDQDLLALFGHAARQDDQRPQVYTPTQQPLLVAPQAAAPQYQQIERYVTKPTKKPTKLRPKIQFTSTQAPAAPQQYLIETTNVQAQQQLQNQYRSLQPQRTAQTLRFIPIPESQPSIPLYERPESQGLKIVPAPNLQNLQPQAQNNYVYIPQYQQPELVQKQYRFLDTQRQQIQAVRQEQPRIALSNVERPLTYLKRFPDPEKVRTVKIYNQAGPEGVPSAPQPTQIIGEQYFLRPLYRSNDQRGRYELSQLSLRQSEQARFLEATKAPLSTIYVNKNLSPKKASRPALRIEPSAKLEQSGQSYTAEQPANSDQISVEQQARALDAQRRQLPPPKNNKAYTQEEFAALVAAGYSVTPIPVGNSGQQAAQSRSSVEAIQIPQRHPLYNNRHQYLPLRSDEAP
ncbi:unnamed protein product, partial [Iphiclides podalirius]